MSSSKAYAKLLFLCLVSVVHSQTFPNTSSVFSGRHSRSRQAYYRWRNWLLNHPAVVQKVPPVPPTNGSDHDDQLDIFVLLSPTTVLEVDETRQTVQMVAKLKFFWTDPVLALSQELVETFTEGNDSHLPYSVSVPSNVLWLPSVIFIEGADNLLAMLGFSLTSINPDGRITVDIPIIFTFSCSFDMTDYPFDEHHCSISLLDTSNTSDMFPVGNSWNKEFSSEFSITGEWDLLNVSDRTIFISPVGTPKKAYAEFTLHLRRKTTYYTVMIILPMVLTSYLNLLVFFVPPDLGDRASYLVTLNVSLSVFSSFFNTDIPRGLDSIPFVFALLLFIYAESLLVLLLSLLVLRKYNLQQDHDYSVESCCSLFTRRRCFSAQVEGEDNARETKKKEKKEVTAAQLDWWCFLLTAIGNTVGLACIMAPVYRL
ncbi:hypothetical protein ACOMHN_024246 [Nucella lapillus]